MTPRGATLTFRALADPIRVDIVERVATGREVTATSLASSLPMTRQAIARHLAALERAGLVSSRREGRETRYEVEVGPLADAAAWLVSRAANWDRALQRLSEHLDERSDTGH